MSNMILPQEEARPEMDDLLRDYFDHEMPRPWPAFKAPKAHPAPRWSRYAGRVALAASVALLVAGYLTLASFFPRPHTETGVGPQIGQREKGPKVVVPMPNDQD